MPEKQAQQARASDLYAGSPNAAHGRWSRRRALRASERHHRADRLEGDEQIEQRRLAPDVVEVVLQLALRIFLRVAVAVADLRPARESRLDGQPRAIIGNLARQRLHKLRALRARADDAHLAA